MTLLHTIHKCIQKTTYQTNKITKATITTIISAPTVAPAMVPPPGDDPAITVTKSSLVVVVTAWTGVSGDVLLEGWVVVVVVRVVVLAVLIVVVAFVGVDLLVIIVTRDDDLGVDGVVTDVVGVVVAVVPVTTHCNNLRIQHYYNNTSLTIDNTVFTTYLHW